MNTTIIELRQNNATTVNNTLNATSGEQSSADYNCVFDPPYVMRDGDQISIKSVFLDTRSNNAGDGRITIDESNNIYDMNHILYLTNYTDAGDYNADFTFLDKTGLAGVEHPDGMKYVVGYNTTAGSSQGGLKLTELTIKGGAPPRKRSRYNGSLLYTDINGHNQEYPFTIPPTSKHGADLQVLRADGQPIDMVYRPSGGASGFDPIDITFKDPQRMSNDGINLEPDFDSAPYTNLSGQAEQVVQSANIQPYLIRVKFTIPSGTYEPETLAKLITDKITAQKMKQTQSTPINLNVNKPTFEPLDDLDLDIYAETFPTTNPYFTSLKQLQTDANYGLGADDVFLIREDGNVILKINPASTDNYLIGANQMNCMYDEELNKFLFNEIHSPILGGDAGADPTTAGSAGVQVEKLGGSGGATNKFFTSSQNSGVSFHSFGDRTSTITQKLLFDDMGFDNSIFISIGQVAPTDYGSITATSLFTSQLSEGVNTTGALRSIDDFFGKTIGSFFKALPLETQFILTPNMNSLVGDKTESRGVGTLSNGYFLVEIKGLPDTQVSYSQNGTNVNAPKSQSIKSVVGRYYATSDYTEDAGGGSIPYIYKGIEQYLTNLNVRILDPDGQPTSSIGSDNTVFVEIIRPSQ